MKKKVWQRLFVLMAAFFMCLSFSYNAEAANAKRTGITATVMTDKNTAKVKSYSYSYTESDLISVEGKDKYGMVIPITVDKKGMLCIEVEDFHNETCEDLYVILYSNSGCTSGASIKYRRVKYSKGDILKFPIDTAGKYYLAVYSPIYVCQQHSSFTNKFTFKAYEYRTGNYSMTAGKTYVNAQSYGGDRYYKMMSRSKP